MANQDRIYFARRAAEEQELAQGAASPEVAEAHRKLQRAYPSGGLEQARAISRASFSPSKIRRTAGAAGALRLKTASSPSSTNCLRTR